MSENSVSCCLSAFALTLILAMPAVATTKDVDDAIALLKEIRTDQCHQKSMRGRILIAHQSHDEETLNELGPQLESLNARLKPAEGKLNALTTAIQANTQDRTAFENAQLEMADCE
jgi:TolA-binding protein